MDWRPAAHHSFPGHGAQRLPRPLGGRPPLWPNASQPMLRNPPAASGPAPPGGSRTPGTSASSCSAKPPTPPCDRRAAPWRRARGSLGGGGLGRPWRMQLHTGMRLPHWAYRVVCVAPHWVWHFVAVGIPATEVHASLQFGRLVSICHLPGDDANLQRRSFSRFGKVSRSPK